MGLMLVGAASIERFRRDCLADHGLLLSVDRIAVAADRTRAGLSNPMATSRDAATIDKKYSGITSASQRRPATWSVDRVAIFGAFLADAHRIADGARIAATISTASTALIVLIRGSLAATRPQRVN